MEALSNITFEDPLYFLLLLLIPVLVLWRFALKKSSPPALQFSNLALLETLPKTLKQRTRYFPFILRMLVLALLALALARPQGNIGYQEEETKGIDIVICLDISLSMLAKDFKPNRLEVAKDLTRTFIKNRPNDRIGLVVFSGTSFTQCPITGDHDILLTLLKTIEAGMIKGGTAIGMGLATSVSRLKESAAKSKVIILLTDGVNNAGQISPMLAANIAKTFGIRIYTIGVGSYGTALSPTAMKPNGEYIYSYIPVEIDETLMQKIATITNGKYFRASNKEKFKKIYAAIDKLEKNIIKVTKYQKKPDKFYPILLLAAVVLGIELLLRLLFYRTLP